jgi:endonuclease V-like protein UPF0215 family
MSQPRHFSNVIGFDDGPFDRAHRGDVLVVGAVFCPTRLAGVVSGKVRRDGSNAARVVTRLLQGSRFGPQIQLVMVQGIAFAGFNVIDLFALNEALKVPVLAVARREPDLSAIRRALLERVPGGARKWAIIERLGPMEPVAGVYVQRVGLSLAQADAVIRRFALHGLIPEPLRIAHLIAGGIVRGESGGRA